MKERNANKADINPQEKPLHFDYIHSKRWRAFRKKILEKNNHECVICGIKDNKNEVHHETYNRLGKEGEEEDCVVLCRQHHQGIHNTLNYFKKRGKK